MDFFHWSGWLGSDEAIVVTLDHAANVQLLDDWNFTSYRNKRGFQYLGGYYRESPVVLRPPHSGRWHVAIDLGGRGGYLRTGIRVIKVAA